MCLKVIALAILLSSWTSAQRFKSMKVIKASKIVEFGFPSEAERKYAIDNGLWIINSGTLIDVDAHYTRTGYRKIFTTIPRFTDGIPYTLATISDKDGPNGPVIYPYPNYEMHNNSTAGCKRIISAFRVAIDECGHMWVIDSGVIVDRQVCPPKVLVFDLNTDKLIHLHHFTKSVYTPGASLLITIAVDIHDPPPRGRCQKAIAYIADVDFHGLVVYDLEQNAAWRVENKLMYPDPNWGNHTIAGESFYLMDGLFSLTLTPHGKKGGRDTGDRQLYFHALASDTVNTVPLKLLNDRTIWENNRNAMPEAFKTIGHRGVQGVSSAIDKNGNMFTNTEDPLSIYSWNIFHSPFKYNGFQIVANDPEQLQFASGMKVVDHPSGHQELWASTCRFQKIATETQNPNEINFRQLACKIVDLLAGRGCRSMDSSNRPNSLYNNVVFQ